LQSVLNKHSNNNSNGCGGGGDGGDGGVLFAMMLQDTILKRGLRVCKDVLKYIYCR